MSRVSAWLQSPSLQHLGDLLVAPLSPYQDMWRNRRARLLSSVFLVSTLILVVLPIIIVSYRPDMQFHTWLISDTACAIIFLVAYVVSRWRSGDTLLVVAIALSILAIILPSVLIDWR